MRESSLRCANNDAVIFFSWLSPQGLSFYDHTTIWYPELYAYHLHTAVMYLSLSEPLNTLPIIYFENSALIPPFRCLSYCVAKELRLFSHYSAWTLRCRMTPRRESSAETCINRYNVFMYLCIRSDGWLWRCLTILCVPACIWNVTLLYTNM